MTNSCIDYEDLYIPRKICKHLPPTLEHAYFHHRGKEWIVIMSVGDKKGSSIFQEISTSIFLQQLKSRFFIIVAKSGLYL
uniref:Uncharacterized protein LOC104230220 isoform X3 n=1 Tax=Nicotiana sylvestris TaxID=4096 RepID=A0A1U7WRR4_NICSY|nr:PREDICTED: uncharacterized protein LOC104230220 isoform X3 [Nicotiana sylvestris]